MYQPLVRCLRRQVQATLSSAPSTSSSSILSLRPVTAVPATTNATRFLHSNSAPSATPITPTQQSAELDQLYSSLITDVPIKPKPAPRVLRPRVYTNATLRRQALKQTNPWYIGPEAFRKIRYGGFGEPVSTRLPLELRERTGNFQVRQLAKEETLKLTSDPLRQIDDFGAGDKILVTKYLSLNDRTKFERVTGLCLARTKGTRLGATFLIRSHKLGEDYEQRFPLYSPFIASITLLEKGEQHFRQKKYYLRNRDRSGWEVKVPFGLAKPSVMPITVDRLAKSSNGKIQVLNFHPMKKELKVKKAGGLGAEMAAAGGADKKGAAPAKPAAPKKK